MTGEQLQAAMASLPDKQGKRIYAHYILGISKSDIARAEGVSKSRISESIERGLRNMELLLSGGLWYFLIGQSEQFIYMERRGRL